MFKRALGLAVFVFTSSGAIADDWAVSRLRGTVLELVNGEWERLSRGDFVSDDRLVRSLNGRATFVRGQESIELASDTVIQIMDREGAQYTVVVNHQGTVEIDAEARNVEHFSVATPHLAAVVKGTRFSVSTDRAHSTLDVVRGEVQMRDTAFGQVLSVAAGESASTGLEPAQVVSSGTLPAMSAVNPSAPTPPQSTTRNTAGPALPTQNSPVFSPTKLAVGPLASPPLVATPPSVSHLEVVATPVVATPAVNPPNDDDDDDDDDRERSSVELLGTVLHRADVRLS